MNRIALVSVALALVIILLGGCGKSSGGGSGSGSGSGTSSTVNVEAVVSTGESMTYNELTGGPNDIALNPLTNLPSIVYYDKSDPVSGTTAIGALKYAYMNANGSWTIEVIDANYGTAACGVVNSFCVGAPNAAAGSDANIMRIAFTSKGTPAVAYVFGASLAGGLKQIRYAERSTAGQWSISVAFAASTAAVPTNVAIAATVDPMKGISLALDSKDRPHILFDFYTQTATNSSVQYLFRQSTGVWYNATAYAGVVTGAGTITALGQGAQQTGMVLCPKNGYPLSTNFVVNAIAGVGVPLYLYCTALNSAGYCSTWASVLLESGCTASTCFSSGLAAGNNAGTRSDIAIDPATNGGTVNDYPLMAFFNTTTTFLWSGEITTSCSSAPPTAANSYGAMKQISTTANAGQNGFRILASPSSTSASPIWYAVNNLSTTNVMFNAYNTTASPNAWFATGHIIDTTTVGADGVGLAFDSTDSILYASYASLPATAIGAAGNDIKVGHAQPADLVNAGTNGTLYTDVVDTLISLFPTAAVPMLAAAKAPNGTVGYSFFYQDNTVTNDRLYYGVRAGTTTSPVFQQSMVTNQVATLLAGALVGTYPSMTYDSNSNPYIAFYDGIAADQLLYLASSDNGGDYFSLTQIDHNGANVGQYPSVATYGSSIGISYYDVGNGGLRFAKFSPSTGWKKFFVDGALSTTATTGGCGNLLENDGTWSQLAFTSGGLPVIAYQSNSTNLKLAIAAQAVTSTAFTWTCIIVDASAATRGQGIAMVLNSADSPYITHMDDTAGTIRLVTCPNQTVGTCISTGPLAFSASIINGTGLTGAAANVITKPTMQVGPDGTIWVAFYSASFQGLTIASQAPGATTWTVQYVDANNDGSSFISGAGEFGVLLLNDINQPMVFYRSLENWLKYFSIEPN